MKEATAQEMEVMSVLSDVSNLLSNVKVRPFDYENQYWELNEIADLASKLTGLITDAEIARQAKADSVGALNRADELTCNAKLKLAGWQ